MEAGFRSRRSPPVLSVETKRERVKYTLIQDASQYFDNCNYFLNRCEEERQKVGIQESKRNEKKSGCEHFCVVPRLLFITLFLLHPAFFCMASPKILQKKNVSIPSLFYLYIV